VGNILSVGRHVSLVVVGVVAVGLVVLVVVGVVVGDILARRAMLGEWNSCGSGCCIFLAGWRLVGVEIELAG
jgi:hypothetical protein